MRKLKYHLLDVFTDRAFGGNQLAVFTNGQGLSPTLMQSIAKELNLSETTFVLPPQSPENDYQVRIFTPAIEMPMAGHPTVGTTFVLALEKMLDFTGPESSYRLEEGVGVIPVTIRGTAGRPDFIMMSQPLPTFGPEFPSRETVAGILSLDPADLVEDLPLQVVSCGVPFLFVPIKSLAAIRQIKLRLDHWERDLKNFAAPQLFVFTQEVENTGSTVHSRMFGPGVGIMEDPATGAASGPLGCYLVRHGLVAEGKTTAKIISEQGIELGRPSFIHIEIDRTAGQIGGVRVGGQSYYIGEGYLEVDSLPQD
jgi:trans-2,3-dihydro-3-hydroxyanthranilate isomerase